MKALPYFGTVALCLIAAVCMAEAAIMAGDAAAVIAVARSPVP